MNFLQRQYPELSYYSDLNRVLNSNRSDRFLQQQEIHETAEAWILRIDLPGVAKDQVSLKVENQTLHLTSKTDSELPFTPTIDHHWQLGSKIDTPSIKASLENGVIEITLPKLKAQEARDISIS